MAKKRQVKFYVAHELADEIDSIFGEQGVTLSEGMSRLMMFVRDVGPLMRPVVLKQAPTEAALALAAHTITAHGQTVLNIPEAGSGTVRSKGAAGRARRKRSNRPQSQQSPQQ